MDAVTGNSVDLDFETREDGAFSEKGAELTFFLTTFLPGIFEMALPLDSATNGGERSRCFARELGFTENRASSTPSVGPLEECCNLEKVTVFSLSCNQCD